MQVSHIQYHSWCIYLGSTINTRHDLLIGTIGPTDDEIKSYNKINLLLPLWICLVISFSVLELALYFIYSLMVSVTMLHFTLMSFLISVPSNTENNSNSKDQRNWHWHHNITETTRGQARCPDEEELLDGLTTERKTWERNIINKM